MIYIFWIIVALFLVSEVFNFIVDIMSWQLASVLVVFFAAYQFLKNKI